MERKQKKVLNFFSLVLHELYTQEKNEFHSNFHPSAYVDTVVYRLCDIYPSFKRCGFLACITINAKLLINMFAAKTIALLAN